MQRSIKYILLLFPLVLLSSSKVYDDFKNKYENIESIFIEFIDEDTNEEGSIKAKKGNKYRINYFKRILICDGETIWNYSPFEKQVIISSLDSFSNDFSLDAFFFTSMKNYKEISTSSTLSSSNGKMIKVKLEDVKTRNKIELHFNQNEQLKKLNYTDDYVSQSWILKNINTNIELDDKFFHFSPPDSIEVIDLR